MNGTGRPCENPTTNIAVLPLVYFFAQGMCLYLLRSGFSVGLRRAKITEICATCLLPPNLLAVAFKLAYQELHERRGEAVRKRPQILPILQPDYFLHKACAHNLL